MPRWAEPRRHMVVILCVCVCVYQSEELRQNSNELDAEYCTIAGTH